MTKERDSGGRSTLVKLRSRVQKTQRQIAAEVGVTERTVAAWEGGAMPHLDKAVKYAESLEISLIELAEAYGLSSKTEKTQSA